MSNLLTKDEKNRIIAEWLEPKPVSKGTATCRGDLSVAGGAWQWSGQNYSRPNPAGFWEPRDFYTSEDASAVILEKMSATNAYVWLEWDINEWCVTWLPTTSEDQDPPTEYSHRDRKAAIADAALALIQKGMK